MPEPVARTPAPHRTTAIEKARTNQVSVAMRLCAVPQGVSTLSHSFQDDSGLAIGCIFAAILSKALRRRRSTAAPVNGVRNSGTQAKNATVSVSRSFSAARGSTISSRNPADFGGDSFGGAVASNLFVRSGQRALDPRLTLERIIVWSRQKYRRGTDGLQL